MATQGMTKQGNAQEQGNMDHFKTGDRVLLKLDKVESPATVLLASANGRSLMLGFEAMIGGYVGTMPVFWSDELGEFVDLINGREISVREFL